MFYRKLLYIVFVTSLAFSQYEYSLEDVNPNSATFGTNVWYPDFSDYITLHYFGTQGWQGWTSIFGQLSDFQELLHEEGYEKVIIIGIGADFLNDQFGESFTENSILPLVLDTSPDYINFVLREQFGATWKELVILAADGSTVLDRMVMDFDTIEEYEQQIYDIIVENYSSTSEESVDYSSQIQPIFNANCTSYCHTNGGSYQGGLDLTSYENLMAGDSDHGPVIIPGDSENSILIQKLGDEPPFGDQMPQNGPPYLDPATIALIAAWIDEGALPEPDEALPGDVNDDGTINILDIVQLANMILSDDYQESADLNGDGNLNILDIVQLVNIILRG